MSRKKTEDIALSDYLNPGFLNLSHDVIEGKDGSVSLIRLIDSIQVQKLPLQLGRLILITELSKNESVSFKKDLSFRIELTNPHGAQFTLAEFDSNLKDINLRTIRFIIDVAPILEIINLGDYVFRVFAVTSDGDTHMVGQKILSVSPRSDFQDSHTEATPKKKAKR
jgi:hypothetical protein